MTLAKFTGKSKEISQMTLEEILAGLNSGDIDQQMVALENLPGVIAIYGSADVFAAVGRVFRENSTQNSPEDFMRTAHNDLGRKAEMTLLHFFYHERAQVHAAFWPRPAAGADAASPWHP